VSRKISIANRASSNHVHTSHPRADEDRQLQATIEPCELPDNRDRHQARMHTATVVAAEQEESGGEACASGGAPAQDRVTQVPLRLAGAAAITLQPTVPATGPTACNHNGTGRRPALQVVWACRASAPRLSAETSPGRREGRLRQAVRTSKGWGLGGRKGSSLSSCWLVLLLGSAAAGSARAAMTATLAQAAPAHRILTHGMPSAQGSYPLQVTATCKENPPRRTAAEHLPPTERPGPGRRRPRPRGRDGAGQGSLPRGPVRGSPRQSRQSDSFQIARIRQPRGTSAQPGSPLLPRPERASQPRQGTPPGSQSARARMRVDISSPAAWSTPEAGLRPRKEGCPSRRL